MPDFLDDFSEIFSYIDFSRNFASIRRKLGNCQAFVIRSRKGHEDKQNIRMVFNEGTDNGVVEGGDEEAPAAAPEAPAEGEDTPAEGDSAM